MTGPVPRAGCLVPAAGGLLHLVALPPSAAGRYLPSVVLPFWPAAISAWRAASSCVPWCWSRSRWCRWHHAGRGGPPSFSSSRPSSSAGLLVLGSPPIHRLQLVVGWGAQHHWLLLVVVAGRVPPALLPARPVVLAAARGPRPLPPLPAAWIGRRGRCSGARPSRLPALRLPRGVPL